MTLHESHRFSLLTVAELCAGVRGQRTTETNCLEQQTRLQRIRTSGNHLRDWFITSLYSDPPLVPWQIAP